MIYLDNAATTMHKPRTVIDAVTQAMCSLGNAGRGATSGALDAARTIHACRAKLTVEGSPVLDDLKGLAEQGVEILTCGTCLDHYGIKDRLAVGEVTNMYVIVEKMEQAVRVVRP